MAVDVLRKVGLTKSAGYEVGIRRTFPVTVQTAWNRLTSPEGMPLWLGEGLGEVRLEKGAFFQNGSGLAGQFRVIIPGDHLRLSWKITDWIKESTLQVRLIPNGNGTTLSFHQENLQDIETREVMRLHWEHVLSRLGELFSAQAG
jgi:uncharacterized protein YndB with AHSA1/START domain